MLLRLIPCVCKYETNDISFTLRMDDVGVEFLNNNSLNHFIKELRQTYDIVISIRRSQCAGGALKCDYHRYEVNFSIPRHIPRKIKQLTYLSSNLNVFLI